MRKNQILGQLGWHEW